MGFRVSGGLVVTGLGIGAGAGLAVVGLGLGGEDGVASSSESENTRDNNAEDIVQSVICKLSFTLIGSNYILEFGHDIFVVVPKNISYCSYLFNEGFFLFSNEVNISQTVSRIVHSLILFYDIHFFFQHSK